MPYRKPPESHEPVIIAGGGLAGLSAALEALEHGSSVIIIESEKNTGGNSAKASSGINAHSTAAQEKLGIIDSATKFFYDTKQAGDGENDEKLVHVLVENSPNAIRFLGKVGVNLDDVNLCGGHSVARTHWVPSPAEGRPIPVGFEIMRKLREAISKWNEKKPDSVRILTETRVKGLYTWNDLIIGVVAQLKNGTKVEINGKAVILATGGFSADVEPNGLLEEFSPHLAAFPTTNGHFARGDGIKMARALDCPLVGMNHVQVHPTAFVDPADPAAKTKFLAAEALRGKGAILIDASGRRFANELGRRDHLSKMILTKGSIFDEFQGGSGNRPSAVMLMSEEMVKQFGHPAFNFYYKVKKFFTRYENLQKLADALRITRDILASTLDTYNADAMKKYDEFGKTIFPNGFEDNKPIYAALVTPAVHYTMGGIKIDKHARVETHYSGLFAAGEVSGGVHGSNRLAGNSLLECVVFGRIAGEMASRVGREKEFHTEL